MTINAPYNFAPLADKVYFPDWGDSVTHDIPFKDGYCGEIALTITAHTPILVGGQQSRTPGQPGNVHFYTQPDGKYAIPGSSLKGMVRAVLEIATFSRMRQVDDMRYGLRDISGEYVKEVYSATVVGKQKAGFMQLGPDGCSISITPCDFAKVLHEHIERDIVGTANLIFDKSLKTVSKKYEKWSRQTGKTGAPISSTITFNTEDANDGSGHQRAKDLGVGKLTGELVLTSQISDRTTDKIENGKNIRGKHHDFLFYNPKASDTFTVAESDWQNFLFVHGDRDENGKGAWPGYWKERFYERKKVPVFYVPHATHAGCYHIGLALLLKLAGDFSTHDLISAHQSAHLDTSGGFDFSDLLFGATDNSKHGALKSRVSFLPAVAVGCPVAVEQPTTILNGPKPSYFPNYLVQSHKAGKLDTESYATYVATLDAPTPVIRGWKRYPVKTQNVAVQLIPPGNHVAPENVKVQTILHPLPAEATFTSSLTFHNLREVELGAILWALRWGDLNKESHRHSIGMGKPFGFGQITFSLGAPNIRPNCGQAVPKVADLIKAFAAHMSNQKIIPNWDSSPQLLNLMAMANPSIGDNPAQRQFRGQLKHMILAEFGKAKTGDLALPVENPKTGLALPDYALVPPTPAEQWLTLTIHTIVCSDGGNPASVLKGAYLAEQWRKIADPSLKRAVKEAIIAKAQSGKKPWWETPPDNAAKAAKAIYVAG